jgi:hypothetical protein
MALGARSLTFHGLRAMRDRRAWTVGARCCRHPSCGRSGTRPWRARMWWRCLTPRRGSAKQTIRLAGPQSAWLIFAPLGIYYCILTILYSPHSPRDAVTITRTFADATTVIDLSISLPRSADEPAYLRPSPPYVRSTVKCVSRVSSPFSRSNTHDLTPGQYSRGASSTSRRRQRQWYLPQHHLQLRRASKARGRTCLYPLHANPRCR